MSVLTIRLFCAFFAGVCIGLAVAGAFTPILGPIDGTAIALLAMAALAFLIGAVP